MSTCTTKKLYNIIFIIDYSWSRFFCKVWWTSKKLFNLEVYVILWTIVCPPYTCYGSMLFNFLIELNEFIELTRVLIESSQVRVWSSFS
jgi:hypothetical protein